MTEQNQEKRATEDVGESEEPAAKAGRLTVAEVETRMKRLPWISSYGQANYVVNCFLAKAGGEGELLGGMLTIRSVKLSESGVAERESKERVTLYLSEVRDILPYLEEYVLEPYIANGEHISAQDLPAPPKDVRRSIRIFLFYPSGGKKGQCAKLGFVKRGYSRENPDISIGINVGQLDKVMGACYQLLSDAVPLCIAGEVPYEPNSSARRNTRDAVSYRDLKKKKPLKPTVHIKPEKGQKTMDEFKQKKKPTRRSTATKRQRRRITGKSFILDEAEEGEETDPSEQSEEIILSDGNSISSDDDDDKPGPSGLSRLKEVPDSDGDGRVMKKKKIDK